MLSAPVLAGVRELVDGEAFYRPAHALIWEAINALADRGEPFDSVPVRVELGRAIARVGGAGYLVDLIESVPTTANAAYYAQIVRDLAFRRRVIETGTRLIQFGHNTDVGDLRALVTVELAMMTGTDVHGWADPLQLSSVSKLPPFPVLAFPDWMGEFVVRLAEQTQTPLDLAGCLALVVLAVAASGKVWLQAPGWREPLCLYVVIALPPGNRKSEVYAVMTAPIKAYEDELREAAEPFILQAAMDRRLADVDAEKAEREVLSAAGEERSRLKEIAVAKAMAAEEIRVPAEPRLYSGNVTIEALSALMAGQGGRYAVLSPEGEIFDIAAGQYSGGRRPNFGVLKHGHAGETVRVDRVTRDGEDIKHATLTLGICTQPSVLESLADTPEFRGQGLLGRILYSIPESLLGRRNHRTAEKIPESCLAEYNGNLTTLVRSLYELDGPVDLTLTPEATEAVEDLLDEHEPRLHPETGDLAHMTDWAAKSVGATLRIAGLLHLAEHAGNGVLRASWRNPIPARTIHGAKEIGDYFTHHAQAAYDAMGADPTVGDARAILTWIKSTGAGRFTSRDVQRGNQHRFKRVTRTEPALKLLEAHDWIRRLPTTRGGRGRPAAPSYEVHPDALAS